MVASEPESVKVLHRTFSIDGDNGSGSASDEKGQLKKRVLLDNVDSREEKEG